VVDDPKGDVSGDDRYTAKDLVDLRAQGHYLLTNEIDAAVTRILERFGNEGRDRLYALPSLDPQATDEELADWAEQVDEVERELIHEQQRAKQAVEDRYQLKFPWS
jgi:hypothetical protein